MEKKGLLAMGHDNVISEQSPFNGIEVSQHSGFCNSRFCSRCRFYCCLSFSLLLLFVVPDPVKLGGTCTADKEVDTKQIPVLWDDDQRISGPNQTCSCQYTGLRQAEFFCGPIHISQASTDQGPFKHRGPEEHSLWACWMVVQWSQFCRQNMFDPVQNPVVGQSERSHGHWLSQGYYAQ